MKKLLLVLCIASLTSAISYSQEANSYGKKLTLNESTPLSELLKDPEKYIGKTVQIEGLIVKVCEKRGCWIDIAGTEGFEKIRLMVDDGVIVFPLEEIGKEVIAEGVFEALRFTKEELIKQGEHMAKEYGTEFDPKTITEGKTEYRLKGLGAVVK
jgi:hypothetical protein